MRDGSKVTSRGHSDRHTDVVDGSWRRSNLVTSLGCW